MIWVAQGTLYTTEFFGSNVMLYHIYVIKYKDFIKLTMDGQENKLKVP